MLIKNKMKQRCTRIDTGITNGCICNDHFKSTNQGLPLILNEWDRTLLNIYKSLLNMNVRNWLQSVAFLCQWWLLREFLFSGGSKMHTYITETFSILLVMAFPVFLRFFLEHRYCGSNTDIYLPRNPGSITLFAMCREILAPPWCVLCACGLIHWFIVYFLWTDQSI